MFQNRDPIECIDGLSMMPTASLTTLESLTTMSLPSPNTLAECSMALALSEAMLEVRRSSLLGCIGAEADVEGHPRIGLEPLEEEEVDEEDPWWCLGWRW